MSISFYVALETLDGLFVGVIGFVSIVITRLLIDLI